MPLALLIAAPACAQVSGSVSVLSDYRYRGASLSDGRPALQVQAGYDFAHGVYAGLLLASVRVEEGGGTEAMAVAYVGRTGPLPRDWHWDAGAQYAAFLRSHEYDHGELYAGIGTRNAGVRLHYADAYFGRGPAWYAEWDARHAMSDRWHLVAHAGMTWIDQGRTSHRLGDWTVGLGMTLGEHEVQLLWNGADGSPHYRSIPGYGEHDGPSLRWSRSW